MDVKETTLLLKRVGVVVPGLVVWPIELFILYFYGRVGTDVIVSGLTEVLQQTEVLQGSIFAVIRLSQTTQKSHTDD